jgi:serine/threonine protein kinase
MDETVYQTDDDRQSAQVASSTLPRLEGYEFVEPLGRGTFGEVWLATHLRTNQKVAVKMLRPDCGLDWRYLENELARLRTLGEHPNIVTLLDADLSCDTPYFVMPHLTGGSLKEQIGKAEPAQVREWFAQAASALGFSHERGLLHCDLKPSNILLDGESRVRLVDFGQSTTISEDSDAQLGSLGFMPPEQIREGARPSTSWDIYALGASIYQLLTGVPPRLPTDYANYLQSARSVQERLDEYSKMLEAKVTPIWELLPELDREFGAIVMAALRRDPEERIASARQIEQDLKRCDSSLPLESRRPWKKSYLLERWFTRNRSVVLLGLLAWCAISLPVMWRVTDFELRVSDLEYRFPATWGKDVPPYRDSTVLNAPAPSDPDFDLNGDGARDEEDVNFLFVEMYAGEPDRDLLTGAAVGGFLEKYSEELQRLEDWDSSVGTDGKLRLAPLGLLASKRFLLNGEPDKALRLAVGTLGTEIDQCRAVWYQGGIGTTPVANSLLALDYLENFPFERVQRETLKTAVDKMGQVPYPSLAEILARRRDAFIETLEASPRINLEEPPVLTFFRRPIVELYTKAWNHCIEVTLKNQRGGFNRGFDAYLLREPSTQQYCFHPIKAGTLYLMERTSPLSSVAENKLYLDSRWVGMQLRMQLELYRMDHGHYPDSLQSLVPQYLAQLPPDPFEPEETYLYRDRQLWSHGLRGSSSRDSLEQTYYFLRSWAPRLGPFSLKEASRQ